MNKNISVILSPHTPASTRDFFSPPPSPTDGSMSIDIASHFNETASPIEPTLDITHRRHFTPLRIMQKQNQHIINMCFNPKSPVDLNRLIHEKAEDYQFDFLYLENKLTEFPAFRAILTESSKHILSTHLGTNTPASSENDQFNGNRSSNWDMSRSMILEDLDSPQVRDHESQAIPPYRRPPIAKSPCDRRKIAELASRKLWEVNSVQLGMKFLDTYWISTYPDLLNTFITWFFFQRHKVSVAHIQQLLSKYDIAYPNSQSLLIQLIQLRHPSLTQLDRDKLWNSIQHLKITAKIQLGLAILGPSTPDTDSQKWTHLAALIPGICTRENIAIDDEKNQIIQSILAKKWGDNFQVRLALATQLIYLKSELTERPIIDCLITDIWGNNPAILEELANTTALFQTSNFQSSVISKIESGFFGETLPVIRALADSIRQFTDRHKQSQIRFITYIIQKWEGSDTELVGQIHHICGSDFFAMQPKIMDACVAKYHKFSKKSQLAMIKLWCQFTNLAPLSAIHCWLINTSLHGELDKILSNVIMTEPYASPIFQFIMQLAATPTKDTEMQLKIARTIPEILRISNGPEWVHRTFKSRSWGTNEKLNGGLNAKLWDTIVTSIHQWENKNGRQKLLLFLIENLDCPKNLPIWVDVLRSISPLNSDEAQIQFAKAIFNKKIGNNNRILETTAEILSSVSCREAQRWVAEAVKNGVFGSDPKILGILRKTTNHFTDPLARKFLSEYDFGAEIEPQLSKPKSQDNPLPTMLSTLFPGWEDTLDAHKTSKAMINLIKNDNLLTPTMMNSLLTTLNKISYFPILTTIYHQLGQELNQQVKEFTDFHPLLPHFVAPPIQNYQHPTRTSNDINRFGSRLWTIQSIVNVLIPNPPQPGLNGLTEIITQDALAILGNQPGVFFAQLFNELLIIYPGGLLRSETSQIIGFFSTWSARLNAEPPASISPELFHIFDTKNQTPNRAPRYRSFSDYANNTEDLCELPAYLQLLFVHKLRQFEPKALIQSTEKSMYWETSPRRMHGRR